MSKRKSRPVWLTRQLLRPSPKPTWINPADALRFDVLVEETGSARRLLERGAPWAAIALSQQELESYRQRLERELDVKTIEMERLLARADTRPRVTIVQLLLRLPWIRSRL